MSSWWNKQEDEKGGVKFNQRWRKWAAEFREFDAKAKRMIERRDKAAAILIEMARQETTSGFGVTVHVEHFGGGANYKLEVVQEPETWQDFTKLRMEGKNCG